MTDVEWTNGPALNRASQHGEESVPERAVTEPTVIPKPTTVRKQSETTVGAAAATAPVVIGTPPWPLCSRPLVPDPWVDLSLTGADSSTTPLPLFQRSLLLSLIVGDFSKYCS